MPNPRPNFGRGQRGLLTPTGPGKGDKSRITDQEKFAENFEQIKFTESEGFVKRGTKEVKVYRNAPEVKPPSENLEPCDTTCHGQK